MNLITVKAGALLGVALLALAGCAAPADRGDDDRVHIVASTSVYGDLAAQIAGDRADVTSFIDKADIDPHSFEASARDQLAIAGADLVIENGGGYDPFMDALLAASGSKATVVDAFTVAALPGTNEHVWYSFAATERIVGAIVDALSSIDPANASTYRSHGHALGLRIADLQSRASDLAATDGAGDVAVTEPVPVYLLEAVGLTNITSTDFTEAIEEGDDVPPLALKDTLALLAEKKVRLLAYNSQTASPVTEQVRHAAEAAGVPVVDFTETLPAGADYVSWMTANLDSVQAALTR